MNNEPTHYILLVGTKKPLKIDYALMKKKLKESPVRDDLAELYLDDADKILSCFVCDERQLGKFLAGKKVNSEKEALKEAKRMFLSHLLFLLMLMLLKLLRIRRIITICPIIPSDPYYRQFTLANDFKLGNRRFVHMFIYYFAILPFYRFLCKMANLVTVHTHIQKLWLRGYGIDKRKIMVIPYPTLDVTDKEIFSLARDNIEALRKVKQLKSNGNKLVFYVGMLTPRKKLVELVFAIRYLIKDMKLKNVKLS